MVHLGRRSILAILATLGLAGAPRAAPRHPPAKGAAMGDLVTFRESPFPYTGAIPEQDKPFLEQDPDGRFFHLAPRAGKLYEETYADRRSLLFTPRGFDPRRQGAKLVLFLHGNMATLRDVEGRQGVPRQLAASGLNAALVAPQLAVNANDSSAGRFWEPGFLDLYLHEAAVHLAERSDGRFAAADIDRLPVILVAYSGGYLSAAFSLKYALQQETSRIEGIVLLDALFGEMPKFADWIVATRGRTFFVSAYSDASAGPNAALLAKLGQAGIGAKEALPAELRGGDVVIVAATGAVHNDFVTRAWVRDPLAAVLRSVARGERVTDRE